MASLGDVRQIPSESTPIPSSDRICLENTEHSGGVWPSSCWNSIGRKARRSMILAIRRPRFRRLRAAAQGYPSGADSQ